MKKAQRYILILVPLAALLISVLFVWAQIQKTGNDLLNTITNDVSRGETIEALESRFKGETENSEVGIALADAYLQKMRETGDATLYSKVDDVLNLLEEQVSGNDTASILAKRAEVANGRHDFEKGRAYSTEAISLKGDVAAYYGIKSDAETELGMYDEALETLQQMVNLKPNFASYSRVAYQRELRGDYEGAIEALEAAVSAGSAYPENTAWAYVELGNLHMKSDMGMAAKSFQRSLEIFPDFAPALHGLGRVAFAEGKKEEALTYYTRAYTVLPSATYAIALGNFYEIEGDTVKAEQQYTLADLAYKNSKDINVDLEYALFLSDHGDPKEALLRAERAYQSQPSIMGADAYAWALYKNGRFSEAEKYSLEALRLGEFNKTLLFHAGMIAEALGKTVESERYFSRAQT